MPPTVIVNMMTAVHSGSIGQAIAFPDVCKTPAPPAPPIPIPYPNIAMSSDAASEASKVTADGSKLMVKGSNIRMSTGDEAGAAMGLVSNKIKGKAEFVNYSFDVKADGKNICRLTDPMTQNMGSPPNAFGPAELQAPAVAMSPQKEACDKVNEQKESQRKNAATSWGDSGVVSRDQPAFEKVANGPPGVVIYIRQTNKHCKRWIEAKHRPKPHEVYNAKTIKSENVGFVLKWHAKARKRAKRGTKMSDEAQTAMRQLTAKRVKSGRSWAYSYFYGIVMMLDDDKEGSGPDDGMPLRARKDKYGGLKSDVGCKYKNTWITGDYDLQDLMFQENGCARPDQTRTSFERIKADLHAGMGWDGIQHGPQAQWVPKGAASSTVVTDKITSWVAGSDADPPMLEVEGRTMAACDNKLTVVYPGGTVHLATNQDVKAALLCMGCDKPSPKRE